MLELLRIVDALKGNPCRVLRTSLDDAAAKVAIATEWC